MNSKNISFTYFIVLIILSCLLFACSKEVEQKIEVIPGKSIAGVEIGMSKERVMSILGNPRLSMSASEVQKIGKEFENFFDVPDSELPTTKVFIFSNPPLYVVINKQNKVVQLNLGRCDNLAVLGYPFLRFDYLSLPDLNKIGVPRSILRNEAAEQAVRASSPKGSWIEYYDFTYDKKGLVLGLVFDKSRQRDNMNFVKPNYIKVAYRLN